MPNEPKIKPVRTDTTKPRIEPEFYRVTKALAEDIGESIARNMWRNSPHMASQYIARAEGWAWKCWAEEAMTIICERAKQSVREMIEKEARKDLLASRMKDWADK